MEGIGTLLQHLEGAHRNCFVLKTPLPSVDLSKIYYISRCEQGTCNKLQGNRLILPIAMTHVNNQVGSIDSCIDIGNIFNVNGEYKEPPYVLHTRITSSPTHSLPYTQLQSKFGRWHMLNHTRIKHTHIHINFLDKPIEHTTSTFMTGKKIKSLKRKYLNTSNFWHSNKNERDIHLKISSVCLIRRKVKELICSMSERVVTSEDQIKLGPSTMAMFISVILFTSDLLITCRGGQIWKRSHLI